MSNVTTQERYQALRGDAEAFAATMRIMVAAAERDGNDDLASKLRVWALLPWEASLRTDDSGDLWPICEACGAPIKGEVVSGGECDLHPACASY